MVVLKAMMQLLDKLTNTHDQNYITLTIRNLMKGDKKTKMFFYENGGTAKFCQIILESEDLGMVEMCMNALAEQSSYKKFVVKVLSSPKDLEMLQCVIKRVLELSNTWF